MARWTGSPYAGEYTFDTARLTNLWQRLHTSDAEPLPRDPAVLEAWALYHEGRFEEATEAGLAAGPAGLTVANKATAVYATFVEPGEKTRLEMLMQVAQRAEAQAKRDSDNPNAWYWHAYGLGRYSQAISVAKALAQGFGSKVRGALERVIRLQPRHADAHIALGAFHAEVIDKVGPLIGAMTYGAKRDTGLRAFEEGLRLNPGSAIAMIECAHGLLMLEGESQQERANQLYEQAAACEPLDAVDRLTIERARLELQD